MQFGQVYEKNRQYIQGVDWVTIHIAYACNDRYVEQTMISMASIFENNRQNNIEIYLLEDHISEQYLKKIKDIALCYEQIVKIVSLDEVMDGFELEGDEYHPRTIYAKLFLDKVCQADRILYLDSDTVVCDSLIPLWKMDLNDYYIAGVKMPYSDQIKKRLKIENDVPYLCDGIMMLNLQAWRENKLREKCMAFIRESSNSPYMLSEGTVNYVSQNHIKVLPPKYNLMSSMIMWDAEQIEQLFLANDYYANDDIQEARKEPVVIHYLNELYIRPWYANTDHPYKDIYWTYRKKINILEEMPIGSIGLKTRILRFMNWLLPFTLFKIIYQSVTRKNRGH